MQTYSFDHPSGAQFELDWNGADPPTQGQLGSILASDSGMPAATDDNSSASPLSQSNQPTGPNQFPTTQSSGSRQSTYGDAGYTNATPPPSNLTSGPTTSVRNTQSTNIGTSYPSEDDYTGLLANNRNLPSYYDLLGIGDTIAGQPSGRTPNQPGTSMQPTDPTLPTGSDESEQDYDPSNPFMFGDAHVKRISSGSTDWTPPQPGSRKRSSLFGGPDMDATPNNSIPYPHAKTDATHTDPAKWTPNYPPGNAQNELKDLHPYTADALRKLGVTSMIFQGVGNDYSSDGTHYATGYYYPDADGHGLGKPVPYTAAVDLYIGPFKDSKGNVLWTQDRVNGLVHQLRMAGLAAWFRAKSNAEQIQTNKDANLNNHIHLVDPIIDQINPKPYNQIIDFMRRGAGAIGPNAGRRDPTITVAERQAVARRYNQGTFRGSEPMVIPRE